MSTSAYIPDQRRQALLEAALMVFVRFGYRKTSMDEVAQAAKISRQGLYLHFANKEELFRAAVLHALSSQYADATAILADMQSPIEDRLVAAMNEWVGRYVGVMTTDAADLVEASGKLSPGMALEYETLFEQALVKAIEKSSAMPNYTAAGISAALLARTLYCTALGIKHRVTSREAFVEAVQGAVQVFTRRSSCINKRECP